MMHFLSAFLNMIPSGLPKCICALFGVLLSCMLASPSLATGPAYAYQLFSPDPNKAPEPQARTVVGRLQTYTIQDGDTLLDIARHFGLGYLELHRLYPNIDPWLPPTGRKITIPRQWVLPGRAQADIVINLPELRLYRFTKNQDSTMVQTYPVGIGSTEHPSPVGTFTVGEKRANPHWYLPKSLQSKYNGLQVMAPGPKNPLGEYWIGLGNSSYGLHGTNNPWSVGRLATNGCIRLYPEHIQPLFEKTVHRDQVQLIYEPVKLGLLAGSIYAEAHPDIYNRLDDYMYFAYQRLNAFPFAGNVDLVKYRHVLHQKSGLPVDVSKD